MNPTIFEEEKHRVQCENGQLHDHALQYLARGWSVIPIRNDAQGHKRAAGRWKPYQTQRPTPDEVTRLFSQANLTGIGVVLGSVSGGLYARDFDLAGAYERWAGQYPTWAQTLPTVKTARGFHVYANHDMVIRTTEVGDGELRGEGGYIVLPPSIHPTGVRYEWVRPFTQPVQLDPSEAGLDRLWGENGRAQETLPLVTEVTDVTEVTEETEETEVVRERGKGGWLPGSPVYTLPQLLERSQPWAEHQNNKKLFFLARGIKALETQSGRVWTELELKAQAFLPWYTANQHLRPGHSQDDYWFEFLRAYDAVEYPLGETFLDRAWKAAEQQTTLPQVALQFDDPEVRQLVLWCRELQRLAADAVFYLSSRSVQARFGLSHPMQAWRRLYGLCRAGILDPVEKGDVKGKKATRYRYLAPLDDEAGDGVADRGPPWASR